MITGKALIPNVSDIYSAWPVPSFSFFHSRYYDCFGPELRRCCSEEYDLNVCDKRRDCRRFWLAGKVHGWLPGPSFNDTEEHGLPLAPDHSDFYVELGWNILVTHSSVCVSRKLQLDTFEAVRWNVALPWPFSVAIVMLAFLINTVFPHFAFEIWLACMPMIS